MHSRTYRSVGIALLLAASLLGGPAVGQPPGAASAAFDKTFVTRHARVLGRQRISYTATVMSTVIRDESGRPAANFVTTDYVLDGVKDRARRPVLFVWSGGPSSPAITEHTRILGPKRLLDPPPGREAEGQTIIDNPDWPIDVVDIVIVDPAETGFSRILPDGKRDDFYSVAGDTRSIEQFMDSWLKSRGREASPIYLWGGSYGSVRAIRIAWDLRNSPRPVDGIFLPANCATIQETGGILAVALRLPTQAIRAVYDGRVARRGRTDEQIVDEAYAFGLNQYLPALATVQDLTPQARAAIAAELSARTGMDAAVYVAGDLVASVSDRTPGQTPAPAIPGPPPLFLKFLQQELGVTYPLGEYRLTAPDTAGWNYDGPKEARTSAGRNDWSKMLRETMEANPKMRVYSANGHEDHQCTVGQGRYLFSQTRLPKERVTVREYPGPHGLYRVPATAARMAQDIRDMIGSR